MAKKVEEKRRDGERRAGRGEEEKRAGEKEEEEDRVGQRESLQSRLFRCQSSNDVPVMI